MDTLIYKTLENQAVRCGICSHFCVIQEGRKGICSVRENRGGRLYALAYPKVVAAAVDPIEKKPLYHLLPGSLSYSIAAPGCNFRCSFCQNADIAQIEGAGDALFHRTRELLPESIVRSARENGCRSISYTYTEPTVFFELALETAKQAKAAGLLNIFVTNGYMSPAALDAAAPFLDAANVDLKAFNDDFYKKQCGARIEPVKTTLKRMKELGVLLEVTTLLIPGLNDDPDEIRALARFIARDLGEDTPWHISRFHPCHRMTDRPSTPAVSLEMAWETGKSAGLRYVYIGNQPGLEKENTHCHSCGELLIRRHAYSIRNRLEPGGICPACGTPAYGRYV